MNTLPWLVLLTLACGEKSPDEQPVTIETVSQKITFDSIARIGPHHSVADISRERWTDGEMTRSRTESIEIAWNSWESFHFQRRVDSEKTIESIVHDSTHLSRGKKGPWRPDFDGEQARMDVYTAWNAWDEALRGFKDRLVFEELGDTLVEGRPAKQYAIRLEPPAEKGAKNSRSRRVHAGQVEGEVVLDKATAVRLRADIVATEKRKNEVRKTLLRIRRSRMGETQDITLPTTQIGTPGSLLKKLPKRPQPE